MKKRILLCLPRYSGPNHAAFTGLACLIAALDEAGIASLVYDDDVVAFAEQVDPSLAHRDILAECLRSWQPQVVGVTATTPAYPNALALISRIRQQYDGVVVMGGPHASAAAEAVLDAHREIDAVIIGEADVSLPLLVTSLSKGHIPATPGLIWRGKAQSIHTFLPASPLDLAQLPVPNRKALFENVPSVLRPYVHARYADSFYGRIAAFPAGPIVNAHATRGCRRACPFCFAGYFWRNQISGLPTRRIRPADHLLTEMRVLRDLGYNSVYFDETAFPIAPSDWLREFADGMHALGLAWGGAVLAEEVHVPSLRDLWRRGLRYLYFGLETPDPTIQRSLHKKLAPEYVTDILEGARNAGVQCDLSLFFGAPGETDETISRTIDWMLEHLPEGNAFFSLAAFWPGTPWSHSAGLEGHNWEPDHARNGVHPPGVVWYPDSLKVIDRFFSNSVGTYHPATLPPSRALSIKEQIVDSGFRERFSKYARNMRGAK